MATTTEVTERIDSGLHALIAEVEWLPHVQEQWASFSDMNRASFSLDWDHLLADYLTELDRYYRSRAMTEQQQAQYLILLTKITDAQPLFERFGLLPITVSLEP